MRALEVVTADMVAGPDAHDRVITGYSGSMVVETHNSEPAIMGREARVSSSLAHMRTRTLRCVHKHTRTRCMGGCLQSA